MTNIEKINLRIENIIFYVKHKIRKKSELCKICGKPNMCHYYRNLKPDKRYAYKRSIYKVPNKKIFCFPYGPDMSEFKK